jgi:hypothetical protein
MKLHLLLGLCVIAVSSRGAVDPFLKASGNDLRNGRGTGEVVVLRGVNLGGWLNIEPWMAPLDASKLHDEWSALDVLTTRFGKATCERLFDVYRDTYIQTNDLDLIAAFGLNLVRLPIWYRTLQEEDGAWRADGFRAHGLAGRGGLEAGPVHGHRPARRARADRATRTVPAACASKDVNGLQPELWSSETKPAAHGRHLAAHRGGTTGATRRSPRTTC